VASKHKYLLATLYDLGDNGCLNRIDNNTLPDDLGKTLKVICT
jgi:hypothetical protein